MIITVEDGFEKEHAKALKKLSFDHSIECMDKPQTMADLRFRLQGKAKFHFLKSRKDIRAQLVTMKAMILDFARKTHPGEPRLEGFTSDEFRLNTPEWIAFQRIYSPVKRVRPAFLFCKNYNMRRFAKKKIGLIVGRPDQIFVLTDNIEDVIAGDYTKIIEILKG